VGGGIAGLALAAELERQRRRVLNMVESADSALTRGRGLPLSGNDFSPCAGSGWGELVKPGLVTTRSGQCCAGEAGSKPCLKALESPTENQLAAQSEVTLD
jgi:hypothetical protein